MIKSRQNNSQTHQELITILEENQDFMVVKNEFPHIAQQIIEVWGTCEATKYMTNLFNDTRDGKRHGFPQKTSDALFHLIRFHDDNIKFEENKAVIKPKKELDEFDFRDVGFNKVNRK